MTTKYSISKEKEMIAAKTTNMLFNDGEYFVANLNDGGVRIGFAGMECFDIPKGHAWFDRVLEANSRPVVEDLHDQLMSAYC